MIRPIDAELDAAMESMVSAGVTSAAIVERARLHCQLVLLVTEKVMERTGAGNAMGVATAVAEYVSALMTETAAGFAETVSTPFGPEEEGEAQGHEA